MNEANWLNSTCHTLPCKVSSSPPPVIAFSEAIWPPALVTLFLRESSLELSHSSVWGHLTCACHTPLWSRLTYACHTPVWGRLTCSGHAIPCETPPAVTPFLWGYLTCSCRTLRYTLGAGHLTYSGHALPCEVIWPLITIIPTCHTLSYFTVLSHETLLVWWITFIHKE